MSEKENKIPLLINREISWLGFNERVLQEAEDVNTPLIERFKFLGIFSSNNDEFYRVRVASVKRLSELGKEGKNAEENPEKILQKIQKIVIAQQIRFELAFQNLIETAKNNGVCIVDETELSETQEKEVAEYFRSVVRSTLAPLILDEKRAVPRLNDKSIYLAIKLYNKESGKNTKYALVEVPTKELKRFKVLESSSSSKKYIILLDDIIRAHLKEIFSIFNYTNAKAYTIKLTRDAELDIDDDLSLSVVNQISKSLSRRKKANPVKFVYDKNMPKDLREFLFRKLGVKKDDNIIPGGRYHNFKDFINFPRLEQTSLKGNRYRFEELPPLKHPIVNGLSVIDCVKKQDVLLNFPYQSFNVVIDLLREAAIDPNVKSIKINLYRVAENSIIVNSLINAAKNGKKVLVVIELRARFDEENNIYWSNKLKGEGVEVVFGVTGLKVHSKLMLISRKEKSKTIHYAYIGTGNFHEITAKLYSDTSLLTADIRITSEVLRVFDFLINNFKVKRYSHLILSPTGTRRKYIELINKEISNAKKGLDSGIIIKLNNLVDAQMIKKLYEASNAGVKVQLIIRGICSLIPGVKGMSENITAISIVDRFLEHSRMLVFNNDGDTRVYISSADWMTRNLDRRVEVSVPIYDKNLQKTILDILDIQLQGNTKARYLGYNNLNKFVNNKNGQKIRSQLEIYNYFLNQNKNME